MTITSLEEGDKLYCQNCGLSFDWYNCTNCWYHHDTAADVWYQSGSLNEDLDFSRPVRETRKGIGIIVEKLNWCTRITGCCRSDDPWEMYKK